MHCTRAKQSQLLLVAHHTVLSDLFHIPPIRHQYPCLYPWTLKWCFKRDTMNCIFFFNSKTFTLDSSLQKGKFCIPFITNIRKNNSHIFPFNDVLPLARIAYIQNREWCSIFVCELGGPICYCIGLYSMNTLILIIALGTTEYEYDKFILRVLTCVIKPLYSVL